MSEAVTVFDPDRLKEIIAELGEESERRGQEMVPLGRDPRLQDVPAETIAVLYEHRWTIEIFFRFFKHVLGCRHLLSHDERGIEIQTSSAIIACMLISLWTGRKPSLRTYEMICHFISGLASEEELLAHSAKLPPQPPDS